MSALAPEESKTVLIADDTAFVRERFSSALETAGHRALLASTHAELIALCSDTLPVDLVVVDLRLPGTGGAAGVRQLRTVLDDRVPVLVFSGTVSSAHEVRELDAAGVDGYLNEYALVPHIVPSLTPHLFPEKFNRRQSPRVVLGIPIAYSFGRSVAAALTLNLGRGGMAIRTTSPFEPEAQVRVRFRLSGLPQDIDASARVRWSGKRLGMGLQFQDLLPADRSAIDAFVESGFFQSRRA